MASIVSAPIKATPLDAPFGAIVQGVDMGRVPSPGEIDEISALLVDHKVILFPDQQIDAAQHLAFARAFGPLETHPFARKLATGFTSGAAEPEVLRIESTAEKPSAAEQWHSDVSWRQTPSLGSILRCVICPETGGDTRWADMEAVYEGLPAEMKARLEGLSVVHDWVPFRKGIAKRPELASQLVELERDFPPAVHPLVRTHPVSGRKCVYVNPEFTIAVRGLTAEEGIDLLRSLFALTRDDRYHLRVKWRPNQVAFWDNRSTQHSVLADFHPHHRLMERVTIGGDRPF